MPETSIQDVLENSTNPHTNLPFGNSIKISESSPEKLSLEVELPYPCAGRTGEIEEMVRSTLMEKSLLPKEVVVNCKTKVVAHKVQQGVPLLADVRNIIAIASGKGGVGKSTCATNIAISMARAGARVGLLDADIYGPSIPRMLGIDSLRPQATADDAAHQGILPLEAHGLQTMSIGFMIDVETPMIWRGPMVSQALDQLLRETAWDDLDYLFVDMPPGTGDIQLTLSQKVPLTGCVIITTPQDIAMLDARKGLKMFEKVGVPIIGLVENMSTYICPECGHQEAIFGSEGAATMSNDYQVEVLGRLPLKMSIRSEVDSGNPTVVASPGSAEARAFADIAHHIALAVASKARSFDVKMPRIVVDNN